MLYVLAKCPVRTACGFTFFDGYGIFEIRTDIIL